MAVNPNMNIGQGATHVPAGMAHLPINQGLAHGQNVHASPLSPATGSKVQAGISSHAGNQQHPSTNFVNSNNMIHSAGQNAKHVSAGMAHSPFSTVNQGLAHNQNVHASLSQQAATGSKVQGGISSHTDNQHPSTNFVNNNNMVHSAGQMATHVPASGPHSPVSHVNHVNQGVLQSSNSDAHINHMMMMMGQDVQPALAVHPGLENANAASSHDVATNGAVHSPSSINHMVKAELAPGLSHEPTNRNFHSANFQAHDGTSQSNHQFTSDESLNNHRNENHKSHLVKSAHPSSFAHNIFDDSFDDDDHLSGNHHAKAVHHMFDDSLRDHRFNENHKQHHQVKLAHPTTRHLSSSRHTSTGNHNKQHPLNTFQPPIQQAPTREIIQKFLN
jgi:hypothetical protein